MIGISGSLICSKTLMEPILTPVVNFGGAPGNFSDLLRSVEMLEREWGAETNGKLQHLFIPSKLQPWFLSYQWKTCL